ATAGLFSVMSKRVRGQQHELFQEFFGAMRRLWLKASIVAVGDLLLGGLLVVNLSIIPMMSATDVLANISRSVTLFVGLMALLVNLYLWPLMVVSEKPIKTLFELSYKLVFLEPLKSVGVLVMAAVPVAVSLLLPRGVWLLLTASCTVLVITWGTWRIIRRLEDM